MTASILSGPTVAKAILQKIRKDLDGVPWTPGLCVIQVGDNSASSIYVSRKAKRASKLGFHSVTRNFSEDISEAELLVELERCNQDPSIHGILVQLPLPRHIRSQVVLDAIDPEKDVDGFHPVNSGLLSQGRSKFVPCTPKGVMKMIEYYGLETTGKHAVVIGRSNIVGRPMAQLLEQSNCTVTICHSRTQGLADIVGTADIVVAAVGIPKLVLGTWLKPGAAVFDVGINKLEDGSICGDVDFDSAKTVAGWITPVPGGVGPMTITCLMENTWLASKAIEKR